MYKKYSVVTRHTGRSRSDSDGSEDPKGPSLWGAPSGKGPCKGSDERPGVSGVSPVSVSTFFPFPSVFRCAALRTTRPFLRGIPGAEGPVRPHIFI